MKIRKIHLAGYKRFRNLTIDLGDNPKRIIALVGPNGCGKSSVFDGMLFHNNAYHQLGSMGQKSYLYHSLERVSNYSFQSVEIEFVEGTFSEVNGRKKEVGKENTIFSFRSSFRYNGSLSVRESKAVSELRKNDFGATSASDIDQRMEQNYRRLYIKYYDYLKTDTCKWEFINIEIVCIISLFELN